MVGERDICACLARGEVGNQWRPNRSVCWEGCKMEGEVGWGLGEGGGEASDKDPCKLKLKISHL